MQCIDIGIYRLSTNNFRIRCTIHQIIFGYLVDVQISVEIVHIHLVLLFYLPANNRILALEAARRDFDIRMEDVARAYFIAHRSDREGVFTLSSEYDAVKERMIHLNTHPDLDSLQPDVLEVAAKMSRISEDLAKTYSDEAVERAREFLSQRQKDMDALQKRLEHARAVVFELRQWNEAVEMDEAMAKSQMDQLRDQIFELFPEVADSSNTIHRLGNKRRKSG